MERIYRYELQCIDNRWCLFFARYDVVLIDGNYVKQNRALAFNIASGGIEDLEWLVGFFEARSTSKSKLHVMKG